jgi:hypothetical protein
MESKDLWLVIQEQQQLARIKLKISKQNNINKITGK